MTRSGETMLEKLEIVSASPFEIYHIMNELEKAPETIIEAELFLPQGEGPFGCVVAFHGSKGWINHHQDHVDNWLDAGLAVCKVDSFSARETDSTVNDQLSVTHAMMLVDAFRTRSVLEQGRSIGLNGDQVDQLEEQLGNKIITHPSSEEKTNSPSQQQIDDLVALYSQTGDAVNVKKISDVNTKHTEIVNVSYTHMTLPTNREV